AIFLFDGNRRLLRANSAASALENRSFVEMNGTPCCELFVTSPNETCVMERAMALGERVTYEAVRDGKSYSVTINPIVGDDGRSNGAVALVRDVTPSRQLAELLGQE